MQVFPLQVLITVVDRGRGTKMTRLYQQVGIETQLMCLGIGTVKSEIVEYFGLGEVEKDVLFSAAPRNIIRGGLKRLQGELPFAKPGGGIACSVTFSSASMAALRQIQINNAMDEVEGVNEMAPNRMHDMIVCVADRGQTEVIMEAARRAGASGGTVVHAHGFNRREEESFLHLLIRPEKEIVMIIVPLACRRAVMQEICSSLEREAGDAGLLFSIPVEDVMGLRSPQE